MSKQDTTNGENEVNENEKPIYGLAFQRADKLFDAYTSEENVFGKKPAQKGTEAPDFEPIATGLRLSDAKRVLLQNGCVSSRMRLRFADKKVLNEKRNQEWLDKYGMTPKTHNDLIVAKTKAERLARLVENLPTASELKEMLGFQSTVLDGYGDTVCAFVKLMHDVVELTDGRLVKESK